MQILEVLGDGRHLVAEATRAEPESLFDRFGWLYALLRESFFRDDTEGMEVALWPQGGPAEGHRLVEVGCGPGFYARRFAKRFAALQVIGVDCSKTQLRHAERAAAGLPNCTFSLGNIADIQLEPVDSVLAVRLFTVLQRRSEAMGAIYRLLKPGGRCVVAEPRANLMTHLPLRALWGLARLESLWSRRVETYREPEQANTFTADEFTRLVEEQPWGAVSRWQDKHYQYAICEKNGLVPVSPEVSDYSI